MKENFRNILAFILLMSFMFNFAHSELGFMTPEGDNDHAAHDFCHLINAATAKKSLSADAFIQKDAKPHLTFSCILPEISPVSVSMLRLAAALSPGIRSNSETPLFVINRTLLI